jgi:hypothetical protein
LLRDDLRRFDTSAQRSETIVGEVKDIHGITLGLVKVLTKEIRANWATIGLGFGMGLEYALLQLQPPPPPWADLVVFTLGACVVQGLLRWDWRFVRHLAKRLRPVVKAQP